MAPNWRVVVVCIATLAALSAGAWRGAFSWHVPVWFALGVMCPAVGLRPRVIVSSSLELPPSSPALSPDDKEKKP